MPPGRSMMSCGRYICLYDRTSRLFGTTSTRRRVHRNGVSHCGTTLRHGRGAGHCQCRPTAELASVLPAAGRMCAGGGRIRAPPAGDGGPRPRASGEFLEAAVVAGLAGSGVDVLRLGVIPTPAVAFLTRDLGAGSRRDVVREPQPGARQRDQALRAGRLQAARRGRGRDRGAPGDAPPAAQRPARGLRPGDRRHH